MKRCSVSLLLVLFSMVLSAQHPAWDPDGVTGGSRANTGKESTHSQGQQSTRLVAVSDMGLVFESLDDGQTWDVIHFKNLIPAAPQFHMEGTASADTVYMLLQQFLPGFIYPAISTDGGYHWNALDGLPVEEHWYNFLSPDPLHTRRVIVADANGIYLSQNAGKSFSDVSLQKEATVAGAFWNGSSIYVADNFGLLYSDDDGQHFQRADLPDTDGQVMEFQKMVGAVSGNKITLYGIVSLGGIKKVVRYDRGGNGNFISLPLNQDVVVNAEHLGIARNYPEIIWMAGHTLDPGSAPEIWRSENGGQTWSPTLFRESNANIETGFMGYLGQFTYYWAETVLDFWVNPDDPDEAIFCDYSFEHRTKNGGGLWTALYVLPSELNPAGMPTPQDKFYHSNGFENTSVWNLCFVSKDTLLAGMSDYGLVMGVRDGLHWKWLPRRYAFGYNSAYAFVNTGATVYAAASTLHDVAQTTNFADSQILGYSGDHNGAVMMSATRGETWQTLKKFADPVTWISADPSDPNTLYACVINPDTGGVFVTHHLEDGANALWERLANPENTAGRPYNLRVLSDGTLIRTDFAARKAGGPFEHKAGIFVSTDHGQSWADRSTPEMKVWAKDLVIHPQNENIWVINLFSHWGCKDSIEGCGHTCFGCHAAGTYITKDRGLSWKRIGDFYRSESATWDENDPNLLYVTTEQEGLWVSFDALSEAPHFYLVESFPFMHPERVLQNPYDSREFYTVNFGNGIRRATLNSKQTALEISPVIQARSNSDTICAGTSIGYFNTSSSNISGLKWHFPGGTPEFSEQQNPEVSYALPGNYTATLRIFNHVDTLETSLSVQVNPTPQAAFTYTAAGLTYTFTDLSAGSPQSWQWDFDDGSVSSEQHPSHTYTTPGTHLVTLVVGNACGADTVFQLTTGTVQLSAGTSYLITRPSPVRSALQVVWENVETGPYTLIINDLSGKECRNHPISDLKSGMMTLDVYDLPAGTYFIRMQRASGHILSGNTFQKM